MESGGEVATILRGLYYALAIEFEERLAAGDAVRIGELRASVESVAMAWQAISVS